MDIQDLLRSEQFIDYVSDYKAHTVDPASWSWYKPQVMNDHFKLYSYRII
jgi:hypothetical protein